MHLRYVSAVSSCPAQGTHTPPRKVLCQHANIMLRFVLTLMPCCVFPAGWQQCNPQQAHGTSRTGPSRCGDLQTAFHCSPSAVPLLCCDQVAFGQHSLSKQQVALLYSKFVCRPDCRSAPVTSNDQHTVAVAADAGAECSRTVPSRCADLQTAFHGSPSAVSIALLTF